MPKGSIEGRIPLHVGMVKAPRILGMIIMALEEGPGTAEDIISRLRNKYRYYPDKKQIAAMCSKYKTIFKTLDDAKINNNGNRYKVKRWALRDDRYAMDREIQTE